MVFILENLVVLRYADIDEGQVVDVVPLPRAISEYQKLYKPGSFSVDLNRGTWSFVDDKNVPIGSGRAYNRDDGDPRRMIIGVYDTTDISQSRALRDHSREITRMERQRRGIL